MVPLLILEKADLLLSLVQHPKVEYEKKTYETKIEFKRNMNKVTQPTFLEFILSDIYSSYTNNYKNINAFVQLISLLN
jgi:hypothetical protein